MRRSLGGGALAVAAAVVLACNSPSDAGGHARDVAMIRLVTPEQTVTVNQGGAQGGLTVPVGATPVTAVLLTLSGDTVRLNESQFEIRLASANAQVLVYNRVTAFAGTLEGIAPGSAVVSVSLFHLSGNHDDFGPHPLVVTVQ